MGKKSLFEDDEPVAVEPVLKVNEEFARRFEVRRGAMSAGGGWDALHAPQEGAAGGGSPATAARLHRAPDPSPPLSAPLRPAPPRPAPTAQHNEKRTELHRLKEKYPERAAALEKKVRGWGWLASGEGRGWTRTKDAGAGQRPARRPGDQPSSNVRAGQAL